MLAAAAESGDYADVLTAAESVRFDKTELGQQTVKIWHVAVDLASRVEAELQPVPAKLDAEYESVVAGVKAALTEIGCGLEAQQAYGVNPAAAEHQLNHVARFANTRSKAAGAAVQNVCSELQAACDQRNQSIVRLEEARTFLHGVVLKAINS